MNIPWGYVVWAFIAGLPSAWAWGMWAISVNKKHAWQAAMWDGLIIVTSGLVTLTLWSKSGDSPWVLLGWLLGNMVAQYYVVKHKA